MKLAFRRIAVPLVALLCALGMGQVVFAASPSGSFDISDTSPQIGQTVTFTAMDLADPDGGTPTVSWDFGDGTPGENGNSVSHQYGTAGDKTVTMTIADPQATDPPTTVTRTLHVNAPPSASFSCSPTTVALFVATTCTGAASPDPEGSVSYAWDKDGDGFDDGSDRSEEFSYNTPGTKTITLRVTDLESASSTSNRSITVTDGAPTARFDFSPTNPNVGDSVSFNPADSTDPENQALNYAWDLNGDNVYGDSIASNPSTVFTSGGNKTVQLRVTDPQGNSDTETKIVQVNNRPPIANAPSFVPAVPNVGQAVSFTGSGSDPDGLPLAGFEWDFNYTGGPFTVDATGPNPTFSGYATGGSKTVALRVVDADGVRSAPATNAVQVNGLPTANIAFEAVLANPNPNPNQRTDVPLVGQNVSFDGSASDDGPAPLSYSWDFGDGTTSTLENPSHAYSSAGQRTVTLTVRDSNAGNTASDSHSVTFRVNTPPGIVPGGPGFIFDPQTPIIHQGVQFAQRFSDPDGSFDSLSYAWDFDNDGQFGEAQESGITCQNVQGPNPSCTFDSARTYPIALRVTDTGGISATETRQVRIQASVPSGDFDFGPAAPLPGQAVTFNGTAATSPAPPAGKQILLREWDFDYDRATFNVDATGASVSRAFASPGPKTVAYRVTEGVPGSVPDMHGELIVIRTINVNAPPQASFNVSPGSPLDGDSVTFSSTSSDPDGPLASHQWDLDGDGQYGDASGAVVSRAYRTGSHPIRLRVTDARGATATAGRQIGVLKRPPKLLAGVKVTLFGDLTRTGVKLKRLLVRAPGKATVKITCKGRKCPKGARAASKRPVRTARLRFKKFERSFPAGTLITVTVTRPGYIGQHTSIKVRKDLRRYIRKDRCLPPGSGKPVACPADS